MHQPPRPIIASARSGRTRVSYTKNFASRGPQETHVDPNRDCDTDPASRGRRTSSVTKSHNVPIVPSSTQVSVSFAADPSLNLILSYHDYKAFSLSLAQKANVTSLSLHGNVLSGAAVLALCGELSSIHCRLTSLSLAMCGLGNENAVRIVEAAIANVHNRRVTYKNPQGKPSVLRSHEKRSSSLGRGQGGAYRAGVGRVTNTDAAFARLGSTQRSQSATSHLNQRDKLGALHPNSQKTHIHGDSGSVAPSRSHSGARSTPRSSSTFRARLPGTYGYNGGLRVLDLSLNHITNAGVVAIADVFNEAALAADLCFAADCGLGTSNGGETVRSSSVSSANHGHRTRATSFSRRGEEVGYFARTPSALSSVVGVGVATDTRAPVDATLSARRGLSPSAPRTRGPHHVQTDGDHGIDTSHDSSSDLEEGEHPGGGLHTLILRFNRIRASGAQRLLRATSDLRVLDLRYCGMDFSSEAAATEDESREREATANQNSNVPASKKANGADSFSALLQGVADARSVKRLMLDGNVITRRQRGQIARLLSITTAGSLRSEGVSAVPRADHTLSTQEDGRDGVTFAAPALPALVSYILSKRPPAGSLYPPAVVADANVLLGDVLYVRGQLRNEGARIGLYDKEGNVIGTRTLKNVADEDSLFVVPNGHSDAEPNKNPQKRASSRRSVGDRDTYGSSRNARSEAAEATVVPLKRSPSAANELHTANGLAPGKITRARLEGVEVSHSVADRCCSSFTPLAFCIGHDTHNGGVPSMLAMEGVGDAAKQYCFNNEEEDGEEAQHHHNGDNDPPSALNACSPNSLINSKHLLVDKGRLVSGAPMVSRRGLMVEGGWERPVCGPCPIVNSQRLSNALSADLGLSSRKSSGKTMDRSCDNELRRYGSLAACHAPPNDNPTPQKEDGAHEKKDQSRPKTSRDGRAMRKVAAEGEKEKTRQQFKNRSVGSHWESPNGEESDEGHLLTSRSLITVVTTSSQRRTESHATTDPRAHDPTSLAEGGGGIRIRGIVGVAPAAYVSPFVTLPPEYEVLISHF